MMRLGIRSSIKYLKIYKAFFKHAFITNMTYRVGFFISILIDSGYSFISMIFFEVIFGHVTEVVGWSYYQILFMVGLNMIVVNLLVGFIFIWGFRTLPEKINTGEIDFALLKPINSIFIISLSRPQLSNIFACLPGIYLMFISINKLDIVLSPIEIILASVTLICGIIISYCIVAMISSLSFKFTGKTDILPRIGIDFISNFTNKPHQVFKGIFEKIFLYILPVAFVSSVPAANILFGVNVRFVVLAIVFAFLFIFLTRLVWKSIIRNYSSASS